MSEKYESQNIITCEKGTTYPKYISVAFNSGCKEYRKCKTCQTYTLFIEKNENTGKYTVKCKGCNMNTSELKVFAKDHINPITIANKRKSRKL